MLREALHFFVGSHTGNPSQQQEFPENSYTKTQQNPIYKRHTCRIKDQEPHCHHPFFSNNPKPSKQKPSAIIQMHKKSKGTYCHFLLERG